MKKIISKKTILIVLVLIFVALLAVTFLNKKPSQPKESSNNKPQVEETNNAQSTAPAEESRSVRAVNVSVGQATLGDFEIFETALGVVENLNSVNISSEVTGQILEVYVSLGDSVKSGQAIAKINDTDLRNQKSAQESNRDLIKNQIVDQTRTVKRYEELYKEGYVSDSELEQQKLQLSNLKEQEKAASSNVANINRLIAETTIRAPIDGLIQEIMLLKGSFVSVGSQLFTIVNNQDITVVAGYPENLATFLVPGLYAEVQIPSRKDTIFKTEVKEIKPLIDLSTRTTQVIIDIDENNLNLRPGSTVNVSILIETKKDAVVIPSESVVLRSQGRVVYVVDPNTKTVIEVLVETGARKDNVIEIVSGLTGNETVVTTGAGFLSDGAAVNY